MKKLQYIVTGTGRCGTVYLANLLTACGLPCGHESVFTPWGFEEALARLDGRSAIQVSAISLASCGDWFREAGEVIADSSYMAAPFLDHPILQDTRVIHVVRHPMDVINSFVIGLNYFQEWLPADVWHQFIYTHVPELRLDYHPLDRAALYYIHWNRTIETRAAGKPYFFCQVETITHDLFDYLNRRCEDEKLLNARKINSRMDGKPEYLLEDIPSAALRRELRDLAERYGYPLPGGGSSRRQLWRRMWGGWRGKTGSWRGDKVSDIDRINRVS
ncbi:MAG TPA: hypothetical protein VH575_33610 [Gemmataceae bacterium]